MSGFTVSVAARGQGGGEVLFRDGWLLRWDGDQLVPMCRSFPLMTHDVAVPNPAPLQRLKADAGQTHKKLQKTKLSAPRNQNVMLGKFSGGTLRFSYAYPALDDEDVETFIGTTAEPAGKFTVVPLGYILHGTPLTVPNMQPPRLVKNAELYDLFFVEPLLYRSKAKTEQGQQKAYDTLKNRRAAQKALYREGTKLLQAAGFNKHSRSVDGAIDPRDTCPRCGCQVFVPFGKQTRKREKLRCKDCGYQLPSKFHQPTTVDEITSTDRTQLAGVPNQVKPPKVKPRMSAQAFAARLRQSGMLQDLDGEGRRRLHGSALQLCLGWMAGDVRGLHDFQHEKEKTLAKRASRLMKTLLDTEVQQNHQDTDDVSRNPLYMGEDVEEKICTN